jgi:peroxiredoxin
MSQNRCKRAFVTPLLAFHALVLVHSLWKTWASGFALVWVGPLVVAAAFPTFMGWLVASGRARTSAHLPGLLAVSGGGALVALLGAAFGATPGVALPVSYAFLTFGGQLLYVFWYSRLGRTPSEALRVGGTLPDLLLEDEQGRAVSSKALLGSPAIFLFYRGNWCPLCMAQIRELSEQYQELEARGAKIVLISPQSHAQTRELAARFRVSFHFLVDPGGRVARQLGILHEAGVPLGMKGYDPDTVLPTAVVTDAAGRILLADQTDNYRVRPEPATFLAALDGTRDG